jgi:hypothetical protein
MKHVIASLFAILFFGAPVLAAEDLVFVINTSENDIHGASIPGAPYLLEHDFVKTWQKLYPKAKVVRIRADSNESIRRYLELWMRPNPSQKNVVGLFVFSHGLPMRLLNESGKFNVDLKKDIPSVFGPLIGRFGKNAKIVFAGCSVLEAMNRAEAEEALRQMAADFRLDSGVLYANQTEGFSGLTLLKKVNPLNSDINIYYRIATVGLYAAGIVVFPVFWYIDRDSNRGYAITVENGQWAVEEARSEIVTSPAP